MRKQITTSQAIHAQDEAWILSGLRLRILGASLLLGMMLALGIPSLAPAQDVKAELSATTNGGYARIVFRFSEDIDSDVRLSNGIVIVTFKQPVDVSVERLSSNASGYVSAARRDPDGKGVRIALARKVTLNSMVAGERLFIDLLPEQWTSAPPSLPQEVVEELSRRAREAERRLRQERQVAQQRRLAPIRLRASHQPTFTRYVFDLPELIPITTNRNKDKLTLVFDAMLKFDLADVKTSPPPTVQAIETEIGDNITTVNFSLIGNVDVRSFREDNSYIIDVGNNVAVDKRADVAPETSKPAAEASAAPSRPSAEVAAAPAAKSSEASAPSKSSESKSSVIVAVPPKSDQQADVALKPAEPSAPQPAPSVSASGTKAESATASPVVSMPQGSPDLAAASQPPSIPGVPQSTAAPAVSADGADDAVPALTPGRDPNDPVTVELRRQGNNLRLGFPFAVPTPSAVFRRADTLWLMFDSSAPIDIASLNMDKSQTIKTATVTPSNNGQAIRIKLDRPHLVSLIAEGPTWTVIVGDTAPEPSQPLSIARNVSTPRPTAIIPINDPSQVHRLVDPEIGDSLYVVTALGPPRGLLKAQDFVEFRALATHHGIAVQPIADDISVELAGDKVVIGRPAGLALSTGMSATRRTVTYKVVMFDAQLWGFDREAPFLDRQVHLIGAAAAAPESKRTASRLELARFYLSRDMYVEAKAVLDVTLSDERPTAEDANGLVLRAVANIMMGRGDDALKDLSQPIIGGQHDSQLWRALALAKQGKWPEASEGFRSTESAISALPAELQRRTLKEVVRAFIEIRDFDEAANRLNEFETLGIPKEIEPEISVLVGRLAEGLGRSADALNAYRAAADSSNRPASVSAQLHETALRYRLGDMKSGDVISSLEILTAVWRGDDTEIEALQMLAHFYTEGSRYRDAFHIMRTAITAHPKAEQTRHIQEEAAITFDQLFIVGKGDAMSAIDALSLFYDYRELTPIGRRGDEMVRRLADRLVSVDLFDPAAELLQHQIDRRLQGAARSQVATRLAVVYLMSRKPDRAIAALRSTRRADLPNDLRNQRLLIEARALSDLNRHDLALDIISNLSGREVTRLRSDIQWAAQNWRQSAEQIELLYGDRWREFQPLSDTERGDIMRAAIGYTLSSDKIGLQRFREKFAAVMADSPDQQIFDAVTTQSGDNNVFKAKANDIARLVASVDTLESFLREMRARYPEASSATPAFTRSPEPEASAPAGTISIPSLSGASSGRAPAGIRENRLSGI